MDDSEVEAREVAGPSRTSRASGGLMTVEDVCAYLVVSRDYVYDEAKAGRLRACRIARQLRFRLGDVEAFVEQHLLTSDDFAPSEMRPTRARRRPEGRPDTAESL